MFGIASVVAFAVALILRGVRRCPGGWRLTVDVDQARPGSGSDRPGLRQQPTGRGGDFQGDREPCSGTSRL